MPNFQCKYMTPEGSVEEKYFSSVSKAELKSKIEQEGNFVLAIKSEGSSGRIFNRNKGHRRPSSKDFYAFNHQLAVLTRSGLTIVSALDTIIESLGDSKFAKVLEAVRDDVKTGESLSTATARQTPVFSNFYVATLKAGEKSSNIPLAISRHLEYLKKATAIKKKIISTSIYPLILMVASLAVVAFLLTVVVPSFTSAFASSGRELPALTQLLISVSGIVKTYAPILLLLLIVILIIYIVIRQRKAVRLVVDRWKISLPLIGSILMQYSAAQFMRTLSTILSAGLPLIDSLQIATGSLNNTYLEHRFRDVIAHIEQGTGFAESIKKTQALPKMAVRMIDAGEKSGALPIVLDEIAGYFENEVETRLVTLTSAIEPLLMIVMGALIGVIVLALYMPVFQLAGTMG